MPARRCWSVPGRGCRWSRRPRCRLSPRPLTRRQPRRTPPLQVPRRPCRTCPAGRATASRGRDRRGPGRRGHPRRGWLRPRQCRQCRPRRGSPGSICPGGPGRCAALRQPAALARRPGEDQGDERGEQHQAGDHDPGVHPELAREEPDQGVLQGEGPCAVGEEDAVELGEELLPAQYRQHRQADDDDEGDDGAGKQAAPDSPGAAAPQVDHGDQAQQDQQDAGAEGGQDDELDVGHVADFAVLEQPVAAAVDEFAEVPRARPVAEVVHGIGAVGHAVVGAEAVAVAREAGAVVLDPEEQGAGDGPDGQHQQDDREAHGEQDLHHAGGDRLGVGGVLAFGVPALHFLLRGRTCSAEVGSGSLKWAPLSVGAGSTAASAALRSAAPDWRLRSRCRGHRSPAVPSAGGAVRHGRRRRQAAAGTLVPRGFGFIQSNAGSSASSAGSSCGSCRFGGVGLESVTAASLP